jgi:hypothetical protein
MGIIACYMLGWSPHSSVFGLALAPFNRPTVACLTGLVGRSIAARRSGLLSRRPPCRLPDAPAAVAAAPQ